MNNKELLELAAKAAGLDASEAMWHPKAGFVWVKRVDGIRTENGWNPLTDDGDALRLAVKLGLNIMQMPDCPEPWVDVCGADYDADELYKDDPYAATRRAIVRAAAEIGKGMK